MCRDSRDFAWDIIDDVKSGYQTAVKKVECGEKFAWEEDLKREELLLHRVGYIT